MLSFCVPAVFWCVAATERHNWSTSSHINGYPSNQNTARATRARARTHAHIRQHTHAEQLAACCGVKDGLNVWGALSEMGNDDASRGAWLVISFRARLVIGCLLSLAGFMHHADSFVPVGPFKSDWSICASVLPSSVPPSLRCHAPFIFSFILLPSRYYATLPSSVYPSHNHPFPLPVPCTPPRLPRCFSPFPSTNFFPLPSCCFCSYFTSIPHFLFSALSSCALPLLQVLCGSHFSSTSWQSEEMITWGNLSGVCFTSSGGHRKDKGGLKYDLDGDGK